MPTTPNPFLDAPPAEVPLPESPLVKVIAQVKFPVETRVALEETHSKLQEALRADYPIFNVRQMQSLQVNLETKEASLANGPVQLHFSNKDGYLLMLDQQTIGLETNHYVSRDDFFTRFQDALEKVCGVLPLQYWVRLGVRYVDRVSDARRLEVPHIIRPECRGVASMHNDSDGLLVDLHNFQHECVHENAVVNGRWGLLPKGQSFDPIVLPPSDQMDWVLDLDIFREIASPNQPADFNPAQVTAEARAFAVRIYTVFRWMTGDAFQELFGGRL